MLQPQPGPRHLPWPPLLTLALASHPGPRHGPGRATDCSADALATAVALRRFDINFDLNSDGLADRGETRAFFARVRQLATRHSTHTARDTAHGTCHMLPLLAHPSTSTPDVRNGRRKD